jgi:hypothetical protein
MRRTFYAQIERASFRTAWTEGSREIVGLAVGPSEAEPFRSAFLKSLVKRDLGGVKLVISNAHEGLRSAVALVLGAWQRCRGSSDAQRPGARAEGSAHDGRCRDAPN